VEEEIKIGKGRVTHVDDMKEYKYLGYMMQRKGKQDKHIKERMAKAVSVMGVV